LGYHPALMRKYFVRDLTGKVSVFSFFSQLKCT
jgi:hypothetical protein